MTHYYKATLNRLTKTIEYERVEFFKETRKRVTVRHKSDLTLRSVLKSPNPLHVPYQPSTEEALASLQYRTSKALEEAKLAVQTLEK